MRLAPYFDRPDKVKPELKFRDTNVIHASISTTGITTESVNLIPGGVGKIERIGRSILVHSVNWRFTLTMAQSNNFLAPENSDVVRLMVILDRQCNGTGAITSEVLSTTNFLSFNNLDNSSRFTTLMDRTYDTNYKAAPFEVELAHFAAQEQHFSDTFFKSVSIPIEYSDEDADLEAVSCNNIFILVISKRAIADIDSRFRIRYTDN